MRPYDKAPQQKLHEGNVYRCAKATNEKLYIAPYKHESDRHDVKKVIKDEDGKVITQPRNFYSNPPKRGKTAKNSCFMPFPEFIADDFEWPRKLRRKEYDKLKALE